MVKLSVHAKGGLGTGGTYTFSSVGDIFRVGGEAGEKMSIPRKC